MKKIPQHLEETLLNYVDGTLTGAEKEAFEQTLKTDVALQSRLQELQKTTLILKQISLEQPSRNFTFTVMNRLDEYPVRSGLSIRNGILLLTGIMIVMGIAVLLLSAGVFDQKTTVDLNHLDLVQRYIKQTLPGVSINGKWVVNTIVLLNLALAFVVLDRAILKPFFQRRLQTGH
jgi:hypothetical protein